MMFPTWLLFCFYLLLHSLPPTKDVESYFRHAFLVIYYQKDAECCEMLFTLIHF